MRLISSKRTKRRIALVFVFAFMLSNLLSLFGPSAKAAVSVSVPSAGTCFQHSQTVAVGALVTVYSIGQLTITALVNDISPGSDGTAAASANAAVARATNAGSISTANDVIGNVVTIIPPTGTNFVIVPGFQDTTASGDIAATLGLTGSSNHLQAANATITNAQSTDASTGGPDSNLAISVGVVTAGTAGLGRAIIAIAKDADTSGASNAGGTESYPKSGTGNNTATISINGLGIAIPPSGNSSLSGTLQATFDATPPSGTASALSQSGTQNVASAIPSISGTLNICTVTSAAGQLEAVLDSDDDTSDLYDKNAASANLLALGQIGTLTRVHVVDGTSGTTTTSTTIAGNAGAVVDIEPILIRGKAGTGTATRDQVFSTSKLVSEIDTAAEAPSAGALNLSDTTLFTNSASPIIVTFSSDRATTTLDQVSILLTTTTPGNPPAQSGFAAAQNSRNGFLGALRAALHQGSNSASSALNADASKWGVASVIGGPGTVTVQETHIAGTTDTNGVAAFGGNATAVGIAAATEPFNNALTELRIFCTSTNPVAGWFATLNSNTAAAFGTTQGAFQIVNKTQAGNLVLVNNMTQNFFTQSLTNITGTTSTTGLDTNVSTWRAGNATTDTNTLANALLYASCTSNTLTIVPLQDGFDATRDIIAVSPRLSVTNISNTFGSDVNLFATVSGNNLTGDTTLPLAKLVGVPTTGQDSTLIGAQGVALAQNGEVGVDCADGSTSSVVLGSVTSGTVTAAATAACTSGSIASPPSLFTGGTGSNVSGTTIIKGTPVVQGEARGILVKELNSLTGFNEIAAQVGGGTQSTVFEVQLPSGCDILDDNDDNNTASSTSSTAGALGGNDLTMITATSTAGIGVHFSGGSGDAVITNVSALESVSGNTPAKIHFGLTMASGTSTDALTTDVVLLRLDAQDVFCDSMVSNGTALQASVFAQNKTSSPTIVSNLGMASLGTATQALSFAFADDVVTSTKGESSTNANIGATPRATGQGASNSHTFVIKELDARGLPIGGRASARNMDPDNNLLSTTISKGQIWVVPAVGASFSTAPAATNISFSDNSLEVDGVPTLVTGSTVDANAPLGTLIIGVKRGTASGAADPAMSTTTVTVKNLKLTPATSSTSDLVASVEFFSQDVGAIVNTAGAAAANSGTTPTVFTPYVQAGTKARTQLEAAGVQLGSGSAANQLLTARLTSLGTPQIPGGPFATVISAIANADGTKITATGVAGTGTSGGASTSEQVITVMGTAGAVDKGAEVVVTTAAGASATTYDSVTVVASNDGSFAVKARGDCTAPTTSTTVTITEQISGSKSNAVTKTVLCGGGGSETEDTVFTSIAGSDGAATISEVLSFVSSNGGLAAIVSSGGSKLAGVIKAAKSALGLS